MRRGVGRQPAVPGQQALRREPESESENLPEPEEEPEDWQPFQNHRPT